MMSIRSLTGQLFEDRVRNHTMGSTTQDFEHITGPTNHILGGNTIFLRDSDQTPPVPINRRLPDLIEVRNSFLFSHTLTLFRVSEGGLPEQIDPLLIVFCLADP